MFIHRYNMADGTVLQVCVRDAETVEDAGSGDRIDITLFTSDNSDALVMIEEWLTPSEWVESYVLANAAGQPTEIALEELDRHRETVVKRKARLDY